MSHNYRLRVVLDAEEDVVRDIEISGSTPLTRLHDIILQAFDLEKGEMASFYLSNDEWHQGEEISLLDLGHDQDRQMHEHHIEDTLPRKGSKMIYVYDFLNLWTFFIEVTNKEKTEVERAEPTFVKITGERPEEAPPKEMEGEDLLNDDYYFGEDGGDDPEDEDYWEDH